MTKGIRIEGKYLPGYSLREIPYIVEAQIRHPKEMNAVATEFGDHSPEYVGIAHLVAEYGIDVNS